MCAGLSVCELPRRADEWRPPHPALPHRSLVSGAFENQILLWRREGGTWGGSVSKEPLVLPHWSTPAVYCLAFDAASKYVASGSEEGSE